MFVVTVSFVLFEKFTEPFTIAVAKQADNSLRLEPECHVFDVCTALDDSGEIFLYETYTDAAAFDAHLASDHFKAFDALVRPWVKSKTVRKWSISEGRT